MKTLRSDEQRDDAVAKLAVVAHPLRHHAIEPHPEPLFPLLQVGLHPVGKVAHVVVPVPFVGQTKEVVVNGIYRPYARRAQINLHVFRSGFDAGLTRIQRQPVDEAHIRHSPPPIRPLLVEVFGRSPDGVVAEVVFSGQEGDKCAHFIVVAALHRLRRCRGNQFHAVHIQRSRIFHQQGCLVGTDAAAGHDWRRPVVEARRHYGDMEQRRIDGACRTVCLAVELLHLRLVVAARRVGQGHLNDHLQCLSAGSYEGSHRGGDDPRDLFQLLQPLLFHNGTRRKEQHIRIVGHHQYAVVRLLQSR